PYDFINSPTVVKCRRSILLAVVLGIWFVFSAHALTCHDAERNWLRLVDTKLNGAEVAQFDYDNAAPGGGTWPVARRLSPVGQRNRLAEWINGLSRTVDYDYDSLRRLTRENIVASAGPAGLVRYDTVTAGSAAQGYDGVGNRRSRKVTGTLPGVTDYEGNTFDGRDLLQNGAQYDLNGNTTVYTAASQTAAYLYDAENRLVKQTINSSDVVITNDADGNRVSKTVGGTTTLYLVEDRNPSGYAQVMEERNASGGATIVSYVYGLGLISQKRGIATNYYGCDGLGSV